MKTVIGIIGTIASGKDYAARYLGRKLQAPVYEISGALKELAREGKVDLTRESLVEFGTKVAEDFGDDYLVKVLLRKITRVGIISGMRQLGQIRYLKRYARLILVAVDAKPDVRFDRAQARGRLGEAKTVEEMIRNEERENSGSHIQRLFECMKLADYRIENNTTLRALEAKLDKIAQKEQVANSLSS